MNYKDWNYRCVPFFKEEIIENTEYEHISITKFQEQGVYSDEVRDKLIQYLGLCPCIVASTFERIDAYTKIRLIAFEYYTDGEVIFNNALWEYIKRDDFALPQKWFDLIREKNFLVDNFEIDFDLVIEGGVDIFLTTEESFDVVPTLKKALIYL